MKKLVLLIVLACGFFQANAQRTYVFTETFQNISGEEDGSTALSPALLDNPTGWDFNKVYAGPQCILVKTGGTITLPKIPGLSGNAEFLLGVSPWVDGSEVNFDDAHGMSISHGELNHNDFSETVGMRNYYMYNVSPESRLTLTAMHPIRIDGINIFYGEGSSASTTPADLYSQKSGRYYSPFDLVLTYPPHTMYDDDGTHNILLYTLDGTVPTRTSPRYEGPISITDNTTVTAGMIIANGSISTFEPQTYTFAKPEPPVVPANTFELTVNTGSLKQQLVNLDADVIEGLTLSGKINGADLSYLGSGEGRVGSLVYLDLSKVTFDYDGTQYRTVVNAPGGGMGTTFINHYYFSSTNYDEKAGGTPTSVTTDCYRNDLSAAFYEHPRLQTIILPDVLATTGIGESILYRCEELKFAGIPDGVSKIGKEAFYYCNQIGYLEFPSSVTSVGDYAFAGTGGLGMIEFHEKVEKIGKGAFNHSSAIELILPTPPDTIPEYAFNTVSIVTIGEGLKYIAQEAFGSNVVSADLPQSVVEIGSGNFSGSPFVKSITPENGIRYIGKVAYEVETKDAAEYTVKEGTVSLADKLFNSCYNAVKFNLPQSLEIIGKEAFCYTNITSLPQMPGVKRINWWAFAFCPKLARITIPESVEFIDAAFYDCNALWSVTYNAIDAYCPGGVSPRDLEQIIIGDKVRRLPKGLYTGNTNITEVVLPKSIEVLDEEAFADCVNLASIKFSDNITTISDFALRGCSALKDIHWPLHLKEIGVCAFRDCSSLELVSLPEGVVSIGYGAFPGCTNVKTLYIASTIETIVDGAFNGIGKTSPATITCTSEQPQECYWNSTNSFKCIKVPNASVDLYKNHPSWSKYASVIVPIEEIAAPVEKTTTAFDGAISENTDLGDAVIGDVYVTMGEEDNYDSSDGSIVLNSTMTEEEADAIGGMAPGKTDIANRFNGLVIKVEAGRGLLTVDCQTIGSKTLNVKVGEAEAQSFTKDSKGAVEVVYEVSETTYIYIYGANRDDAAAPVARRVASRDAVPADCIKIYAVGVDPKYTSIDDVLTDYENGSPIIRYYTVDGVEIDKPVMPGIYVVRQANGKTSKILVR